MRKFDLNLRNAKLTETAKQREIWKVFNQKREIKRKAVVKEGRRQFNNCLNLNDKNKQAEINNRLKNIKVLKDPRPRRFDACHPLIPVDKKVYYGRLKSAILKYLTHRTDFKDFDRALIEQAARLYADWLYCEELLSADAEPQNVARFADALGKIHMQLITCFNELHLTPAMRRKIADDLEQDDEITKRIKELLAKQAAPAQTLTPPA